LGVLTFRQAGLYRTPETLYREAVAKNPGAWLAYNNLGEWLGTNHRYREAEVCIAKALALKSDEPRTLHNMGTVMLQAGRYADAIDYYSRALKLMPNSRETRQWLVAAHKALGDALRRAGKNAEAKAHYEEAERISREQGIGLGREPRPSGNREQ
jgi:tetratricopeptide (TPR) repeat protein